MHLEWVAAMYNKAFGKQRRRTAQSHPQLQIVRNIDNDPQKIIIGSSIIARWRKHGCKISTAQIIGIEGLDTFDLMASKSFLLKSPLKTNDVIMVYCGSNDFFRNRPIKVSIKNLTSVFNGLNCNIIYLKVIKSPLMRYFATDGEIDEFNNTIEQYLLQDPKKCLHRAIAIDTDLIREDYVWDGVHLSNSGYRKIEKAIRDQLGDAWFESGG